MEGDSPNLREEEIEEDDVGFVRSGPRHLEKSLSEYYLPDGNSVGRFQD
jgi:hypothetical protein